MISVIVPLYNYARFIEENLRSIMRQKHSDWEIIVVDDCSTDNPHSVIKKYLSDRIKHIRLDENVGYGAAKNVGIRASKGQYIVVLDADDMLTRNSLGARLKALKCKKALWLHARAYEFNGKPPYRFRFKKRKAIRRLAIIRKSRNYKDLWENIHAQTVMVHRSIYEKVGLYEPSLRSMGDKEMWARIINNVGPPLYIKDFVACYRQHRDQMHRSKYKKRKLKKYMRILRRCLEERKNGDFSSVERM